MNTEELIASKLLERVSATTYWVMGNSGDWHLVPKGEVGRSLCGRKVARWWGLNGVYGGRIALLKATCRSCSLAAAER